MTAAVMRGKITGLAMLAALSAGAPAPAQDADQLWGWCFGDATDDRTIQGCDAVIATGRGSQKQQAGAFYNRGVAHRNKGQLDLALRTTARPSGSTRRMPTFSTIAVSSSRVSAMSMPRSRITTRRSG